MRRHLLQAAILIVVAASAERGAAQDFEVPVDFSLYVSETSELYPFAPPHPTPPSPLSLDGYFCRTLADETEHRTRVIAYPPVCT